MGICPGSVRPKTKLRRQSTSTSHKPILILNLISAMSLITTITFAALFFSLSPSKSTTATARPLRKLPHPVVILISSDGFCFGYQFKNLTPKIYRLINNGTEAQTGLLPVFPTLTFPNHYSIVIGLYPFHHVIINNFFIDPITDDKFTMASHESKWWLGQTLWETLANYDLTAATYFWLGSEVIKGLWTFPERFCKHYNNGSVNFEDRVDSVLDYFDLPLDEIPVFMTLYFKDPDHH